MLIAYADGADSPRSAPEVVARAIGAQPDETLLGWTPEGRGWLSSADLRGRTVMAGYALAPAVASGHLVYLPLRLSAVPRLLNDTLIPDIAVVTGVRRGGELAFGSSVGWGPAAAAVAGAVVVEIDEEGPDLGGPLIPGRIVATIERPPAEAPMPMPRVPDAVDLQVGRNVASIVPDGATLQLGPGGVADGILAALDQPVQIRSGLVSDAVADLDERGLLRGAATAGYAWGGDSLGRLAAAGKLTLLPLEETHDLTKLSSLERFVGCNTALQVGLDGSVNVEMVNGRWVAGIGGHADFCAAAARSVGGLSIIALRSTTKRGRSTIVPGVEVTSTPRCDVDMVVTENGVADLRHADDAERARRLIEISAPEHRSGLAAAIRAGQEPPDAGVSSP